MNIGGDQVQAPITRASIRWPARRETTASTSFRLRTPYHRAPGGRSPASGSTTSTPSRARNPPSSSCLRRRKFSTASEAIPSSRASVKVRIATRGFSAGGSSIRRSSARRVSPTRASSGSIPASLDYSIKKREACPALPKTCIRAAASRRTAPRA